MPDRLHLVRLEWERAAVDGHDRGREALGGAQQPTRAPVGEPEQERDAQRPHERRREHGIDRAHVRDDCSSTQSGQLAGECSFETRSAAELAARAKRPHAAVRGQDVIDRAVCKHDDLVDERRERRDLGHRRCERGVPGIDLLRDEDDPGQSQKKSVSPKETVHASERASSGSASSLPMKSRR